MALFELHRITHQYNGRTVLAIDHYRIKPGAILGLWGPNGSGKSTLLNILGLIHPPRQGEVIFNGRPAEPFTPGIRDQIALMPQEAYLLHRTVYDNIVYGLRIRKKVNAHRRRIEEAMSLVGLSAQEFGPRPWFALSGGEARRVALAARLVLKPKVLLLDEPTASVDDTSTQIIKEAVLHAHRHWGTTLIIASHDEQWLEDISDSRLHLYQGRRLPSGSQTLIYGPWQQKEPGLLVRGLAQGMEFLAMAPAEIRPDATATIHSNHVVLHSAPPQPQPGHHSLEGTILRLTLDKPSGRIKASILVGGIVIAAILPVIENNLPAYAPGQHIWLAYDISRVRWI
jgi:tungstate transport system ATP-binding protein